MATVEELSKQGITRMRLPIWNEYAWLEVPLTGPWAYLHDVLDDVGTSVLISQCVGDEWVEAP